MALRILDRLFRSKNPGPGMAPILTPEQVAFWENNGYLTLRGFVPPEEIARVKEVVDDEWRGDPANDHEVDVNSGPYAGRAYKMREVHPSARSECYKLNNLFGRRSEIRQVALSPRMRAVCAQLLEGEPMICNSLNFERGSQQEFHIDTWYMPPPVENCMVVSFIALEDIGPTAGPLKYYPGSHLVPPYRFSHGRLDAVPEEIPACLNCVRGQLAESDLQGERFTCKAGDVFLWHAQLFHGGSEIDDRSLTRRSIVTHYWRAMDVDPSLVATVGPGRHYLNRPPQVVSY